MSDILLTIRGNADIPNEVDLQFTNLASITKHTTVKPVPDSYDGSYPQDIHKKVRQDLSTMIVPTNHDLAPVAPNFFVEAKAPRGGADVAKRQACLDGAVGARVMHSLQNYGEEAPVYDGNAYAYSSTYHAGTGTLQLYAHHATAAPSGSPSYHMTQVKGYAVTSDRDTFIAGATAFRNARDLAKQHRDSFIGQANARASRPEEETMYLPHGADSASHINYSAWLDADDALQQNVAETSHLNAYEGTAVGSIPQYLYGDDGSPENSQQSTAYGVDEPSLSFTSSFTSVSTERARSKRPRQSASPPSMSKKGHSALQER